MAEPHRNLTGYSHGEGEGEEGHLPIFFFNFECT